MSNTLDQKETVPTFDDKPLDPFINLNEVVSPEGIPIGKSSFHAGVASGKYPRPIKIGRLSFWKRSWIKKLREDLERASEARSRHRPVNRRGRP